VRSQAAQAGGVSLGRELGLFALLILSQDG
jgi:hypothetical protein